MEYKYKKPIKVKLVNTIKHQGIGGKIIILEREMSLYDVIGMETIAAYNFVNRRPDLMFKPIEECKDIKCYYGHVKNLGYFVAEDEFNGKMREVDWNEAVKYLD